MVGVNMGESQIYIENIRAYKVEKMLRGGGVVPQLEGLYPPSGGEGVYKYQRTGLMDIHVLYLIPRMLFPDLLAYFLRLFTLIIWQYNIDE